MRTTVTLDPDVAEYIREACHKKQKSFKRVLNDALRESLKPTAQHKPELKAPRSMGIAPGVDPRKLSELADDLEAEAFLAAEEQDNYNRKQQQ